MLIYSAELTNREPIVAFKAFQALVTRIQSTNIQYHERNSVVNCSYCVYQLASHHHRQYGGRFSGSGDDIRDLPKTQEPEKLNKLLHLATVYKPASICDL